MVDQSPPKCAGVLLSQHLKPTKDLDQLILLRTIKRFFQSVNRWTVVLGFEHQLRICQFGGLLHPSGHPVLEGISSRGSPRVGQSLSCWEKLTSRNWGKNSQQALKVTHLQRLVLGVNPGPGSRSSAWEQASDLEAAPNDAADVPNQRSKSALRYQVPICQ